MGLKLVTSREKMLSLALWCCITWVGSVLSLSVVSNSVRPHRQQPTRLPHPWDSPGKNTGVGCHCLLQGMKVKSESEVTQSCQSLWPHGLQPTRLLHPWDFPGKSAGVGCHPMLGASYSQFHICNFNQRQILVVLQYTFTNKNPSISRPMHSKSMLFKV